MENDPVEGNTWQKAVRPREITVRQVRWSVVIYGGGGGMEKISGERGAKSMERKSH